MMKKNITIAIDGPAAAGKSTVAKAIAKKFNFLYIDTGAMYRAYTYYVLKKGINPKNEADSIKLISEINIVLLNDGRVLVNDEDVTKAIREINVSSFVSYIASYKDVRLALVSLQRKMAENTSVIMDGRDIGTYVLPNADVKIFMIASKEERAKRRYLENIDKHISCTYEDILFDVQERDRIDSSRAFCPLKAAEDSIQVDTSSMSIQEVVDYVSKIIIEKTHIKL